MQEREVLRWKGWQSASALHRLPPPEATVRLKLAICRWRTIPLHLRKMVMLLSWRKWLWPTLWMALLLQTCVWGERKSCADWPSTTWKLPKNGIITNTAVDETPKAIPIGTGLAITCVRWISVATGKSRTKVPLSAFATVKTTARTPPTWRCSIPLYSEASWLQKTTTWWPSRFVRTVPTKLLRHTMACRW